MHVATRRVHAILQTVQDFVQVVGVFCLIPMIRPADISVYCLQAGLQLLRSQAYETPPLMYLSTTDFVQHKWAPDDPEANEFYRKIDGVLGELDDEGVIVGLTADHGMNAKVSPNRTAPQSPRLHATPSPLSHNNRLLPVPERQMPTAPRSYTFLRASCLPMVSTQGL